MNLSVGIIGLPNVGKSTLFNALLKKQQAFVANFPFATIEPNVGVVPVPDERLEKLAEIVAGVSTSEESDVSLRSALPPSEVSRMPPIVPAIVKFVDIAGLVKGANEGAGLGNKFLSHIREVSIIAHVVRAFEDPNVIREGSLDPKSDYETINTELILADLATISKIKDQKSNIQIKNQKETAYKLFNGLNKGIPAREVQLTEEEQKLSKQFFLLSAKPEIVVLNVSEEDYTEEKIPEVISKYSKLLYSVIAIPSLSREKQSQGLRGIASSPSTPRNDMVVISAKIEAELAELSEEEQKQYLEGLGLKESGLERLIRKAYETLGLISFLTAGEKEVRAWTIKNGANAVEAAGEIHTDFMKKFIKAEAVSFDDFVEYGGWKKARGKGKTRIEGKDYVMKDGDVVEFKIGQ